MKQGEYYYPHLQVNLLSPKDLILEYKAGIHKLRPKVQL